MKKRVFALALVLVLCLSSAAFAKDYSASGLFSVSYDENAFSLNSTEYLGEKNGTALWLFIVFNDKEVIDSFIETKQLFGSISLISPTDTQLEDHIWLFEELYQDLEPENVSVLRLENGITFPIFRMKDEYGYYLLAQTVIQGYSIDFKAYYTDNADADDALLQTLTKFISTFRPAD